jgi:CubicO group peptidase (beta-lactamase class C family)
MVPVLFAIAATILCGQVQVPPNTRPNQRPTIPKGIKLLPCVFKEPQPGYLESFAWVGDIPMSPSLSRVNEIDKRVLNIMRDKSIPGAAVIVMEDNEVIHSRGYGYSNLGTSEVFTPTTPTRCGSISKTATGLALLRAATIGGLKLDDNLSQYFSTPKGVKAVTDADQEGWDKIRVRDLIDHLSGISGNYLTTHELAKKYSAKMPMTLEQFVYTLRKSRTPSGTKGKYEYHNLNFALATYVLEKATQKDFGDALYWLVNQPLGIPKNEMFLSPTYGSKVPKTLPNGEARCYQMRSDFPESIFKAGENLPEAYGGLDGNILSGAGHIAFSANAVAKMVVALRKQPSSYLSGAMWQEIATNPKGDAKVKTFYSKGTNVDLSTGTYSHTAMLMHAGGEYSGVGKKIQYVVLANSNSKIGEALVNQHLATAVRQGLAAMKKTGW